MTNQTKNKNEIKCLCCKGKINIKMGGQKFCNNCSVYLSRLKAQLYYYHRKSDKLSIKLYGVKNGNERLRI